MKVARFARNVVLVALAFRLIVRRRNALARERRARRIAPLLLTAGGTGVILAVGNVVSKLQRDVGEGPAARTKRVIPNQDQQPRALAEAEPSPRVNKRPKRVARSAQSKKGKHKSAYGVKAEGEERSERTPRSERTTEAVEPPKH
jgi:hypothetical protein